MARGDGHGIPNIRNLTDIVSYKTFSNPSIWNKKGSKAADKFPKQEKVDTRLYRFCLQAEVTTITEAGIEIIKQEIKNKEINFYVDSQSSFFVNLSREGGHMLR